MAALVDTKKLSFNTLWLKIIVGTLIGISIFVSSITFADEPIDLRGYYIAVLLVLPILLMRSNSISKPILIVLIIMLAVNILNIALGNNYLSNFLKTYISTVFFTLFSYWVIQYYKYDVLALVKTYTNFSVFVALFGISQFLFFLIGFKPGYDYSWLIPSYRSVVSGPLLRVNSFTGEPSHLAQALAPAFFLSLCSAATLKPILVKKWKAFLIILVYILSFSSLAFIGIFLTLLLIGINYGTFKQFIIISIVSVMGFLLAYNFYVDFRIRVDSMVSLIESPSVPKQVDLSSFTLFNNLNISVQNFRRHPLIGTGMGSHPIAYEKYSLGAKWTEAKIFIQEFNKQDANSLFLRLMSEYGLLGIIAALFFTFKHWVRKKKSNFGYPTHYWIISNACLMMFLLSFLRKGHYFQHGIILFILIYYYNSKEFHFKKKNQKNKLQVV